MRRLALTLGLLALASCSTTRPPDQTFAVYFTDFSATLTPVATEAVNNAAAVTKRVRNYKVTVTGYADAFGSPNNEVLLSKQRADAVANLLVQDGVDASRIQRAAVGTPPNSQPGVERRRVEIDID